MHKAQPMDREAACEYLKKHGRDVEAGMVAIGEHDAHAIVQLLAEFRLAIAAMILTDPNIAAALQQRICCNGVDCGCYGATVEHYLQYQLIERSR